MKKVNLPDFKIRYVLNAIFYLLICVTTIQCINFFGVMWQGLEFLSWWPLGSSMLFGLGGVPSSTLTAHTSGLAIELSVPGLADYYESHWLTRAGLSLLTSIVFLSILGIFRTMVNSVDIQQPFDPANIRRVQLILALLLFEIFGLDYLRTQSMLEVKTMANQMNVTLIGTDSSYQNADAYAYILILALLTSLAVFRRGMVLHQKQITLEKQLYQKQKLEALGTLASGIGHDFNNILTSITGYAEIAKSQENKADVEFALTQVLESSNRAKRLTQQIRAMGPQSHDPTEDESIDLSDEIDELLLSFAPSVTKNSRIVKKYDSEANFEVNADSTKIYQVLLNLCTNALQAMESKTGLLTIDIYSQQRHLREGFCVSIEDNGCGISPHNQHQIFDPYFTTRTQLGGTGLGLSLCYSIIDSYGGDITVTSKLGKGSCFKVWLPKALNDNAPPEQPTIQTSNCRILLIDDDSSILSLAKRRLSGLGYNVDDYIDCQTALDAFTQSNEVFDLVITDFNMPQMSGIQLAEKIQQIRANTPVVIITGAPEKVVIDKSLKVVKQVVSKPIAFSELQKVIESLVRKTVTNP